MMKEQLTIQKRILFIFVVTVLGYGITSIGYAHDSGTIGGVNFVHFHGDTGHSNPSTTRSIAENTEANTNLSAAFTAHNFNGSSANDGFGVTNPSHK